jgi:hypothetical protein
MAFQRIRLRAVLANQRQLSRALGVIAMRTSYEPTTDLKFLGTLESWLQSQPEILVLIRYSHAAGSRDFEFFSSFQSLSDRIRAFAKRRSVLIRGSSAPAYHQAFLLTARFLQADELPGSTKIRRGSSMAFFEVRHRRLATQLAARGVRLCSANLWVRCWR